MAKFNANEVVNQVKNIARNHNATSRCRYDEEEMCYSISIEAENVPLTADLQMLLKGYNMDMYDCFCANWGRTNVVVYSHVYNEDYDIIEAEYEIEDYLLDMCGANRKGGE